MKRKSCLLELNTSQTIALYEVSNNVTPSNLSEKYGD